MKWYLGTNCGHGSSAAAVTEDGVLSFAVEEGRLIGDKETSRVPIASIRLAMEEMGGAPIRWGEGWNSLRRLLFKGMLTTARYGFEDFSYIEERLRREIGRMVAYLFGVTRLAGQIGVPWPTGHHVAHACSLLPWGLEPRTLVFVSDYIGEWAAISAFYWDGRRMRLIRSTPFPHSLGAVFHQAATHLGFSGRQAPGKLMALAGYGEPRWVRVFDRLASVRNGRVVFDQKQLPLWFRRAAWRRFGEQNLNTEIGRAMLASAGAQEQGADFAASIQYWFTELTWRCVASNVTISRKQYGLEVAHLALAGGCALNCQTNGVIVRRGPALGLADVLVSPWSDDSGTAVGAAVMQSMRAGCRVFARATPFLGPQPSARTGHSWRFDSLVAAIDALCAGEIIALVCGRLEFGPRALGGRCLLASPSVGNMKQRLNRIKGRPSFMPFAPVVRPAAAQTILNAAPSTNMAWTVPFKPATTHALSGISHPSGETRAQLVGWRDTSVLGHVLDGFRERSGVDALILKSLNGHDEEIPAYLDQALKISHRLGIAGVLHDGGWIPMKERPIGEQG